MALAAILAFLERIGIDRLKARRSVAENVPPVFQTAFKYQVKDSQGHNAHAEEDKKAKDEALVRKQTDQVFGR